MSDAEPDPIIQGVLAIGDRCYIAGPPKSGRSFIAAQLALAISAGLSGPGALGYCIPAPRRVSFVQFQSAEHHISRRLNGISAALGINPSSLMGKIQVLNLRQLPDEINNMVLSVLNFKPEVMIIDAMENMPHQLAVVANNFGGALLAVCYDTEAALRKGDSTLLISPNIKYDNVAIELDTLTRHGRSPWKKYLDWERDILVVRECLSGGLFRDAWNRY